MNDTEVEQTRSEPHEIFLIEDILLLILECLDSAADLARAERVCRLWCEIGRRRGWRAHLIRDFGGKRLSEANPGDLGKEMYKIRLLEQRANEADLTSSMIGRIPESSGTALDAQNQQVDQADTGEVFVPLIAYPWLPTQGNSPASAAGTQPADIASQSPSSPPQSPERSPTLLAIRHGIHRSVFACRNHVLQYRVAKRFLVWQLRQTVEREEDFAAGNLFSGRIKRVLSCEMTPENPLIFLIKSIKRNFHVFRETGEPMDEETEGMFSTGYAALFDLHCRLAPPRVRSELRDLNDQQLLARLLSKERTILAAFPHSIAEGLWDPAQRPRFELARRYVFANSYIPGWSHLGWDEQDPSTPLPPLNLNPFLEPQQLVGWLMLDVPGSDELAFVYGGIGQSRLIVLKETGAIIRSRIGLPGRVWRALLKRASPPPSQFVSAVSRENVLDNFRQQRLPYFTLVERENYEPAEDEGRESELLGLLRWE